MKLKVRFVICSFVLLWSVFASCKETLSSEVAFNSIQKKYHIDNCLEFDKEMQTASDFVVMAKVKEVEFGLCVEANERHKTSWKDANQTCMDMGMRLPTYDEWRTACDGKISGDAGIPRNNSYVGNMEWASSQPHVIVAGDELRVSLLLGLNSCTSVGFAYNSTLAQWQDEKMNFYYRCVY